MPQMNKGGKFIFGKSLIRDDLTIHLPTQALTEYNATAERSFIKYKGQSYCWVNISKNGIIQLNQQTLDFLNLKIGMELLSIRSSDIAFTMGATGPLLERADNYEGEIPLY